jgi:hypothetical protein
LEQVQGLNTPSPFFPQSILSEIRHWKCDADHKMHLAADGRAYAGCTPGAALQTAKPSAMRQTDGFALSP